MTARIVSKTGKTSTAAKTKKTAKKTPPKKQKELKSGARYVCDACGLAMTVDNPCGCTDFCDIICCGEQMKPA